MKKITLSCRVVELHNGNKEKRIKAYDIICSNIYGDTGPVEKNLRALKCSHHVRSDREK